MTRDDARANTLIIQYIRIKLRDLLLMLLLELRLSSSSYLMEIKGCGAEPCSQQPAVIS